MEPYRSCFEPVPCKQAGLIRTIVDPITNRSEHILFRVNVAKVVIGEINGGSLFVHCVAVVLSFCNFSNEELYYQGI